MEILAGYSPAQIREAFKDHLQCSRWFPKPAEILELIEREITEENARREQEATRRHLKQLAEERAARIAAGEKPFGWAEVLQKFQEIFKSKKPRDIHITEERRQVLREQAGHLMESRMAGKKL